MEALLSLPAEHYWTFLHVWAAMSLLSALGIHLSRRLPISNRMDVATGSGRFGRINKRAGWIIMEAPVLLSVLYFYLASTPALQLLPSVMVGVFVFHYTHRALIYPYRIKVQGKTMPVGTVLSSMVFYIVNGYLIGYYFGALRSYPEDWLWDPRFILGLLLFAAGFWINVSSDNILIRLRKPGESGYKIPHGGFFRWVSCPNYFGEMVEWLGFALMTWSLPGAVYALWVGLPLLAQALLTHRWYRQQFGAGYPAARRAVIPGLL